MTNAIKTVAIAGAGTMGSGIAQVTATAGYKTILFDINPNMLASAGAGLHKTLDMLLAKQKINAEKKEAIISNLVFTTDVNQLVADLVIEAVVEQIAVKHSFFQSVAAINPPSTILATNTSSIPVTQVAAKIPDPGRVAGIHFFNPAPVMKLVELIKGVETSDAVAQTCREFIESLGKTCVVANDAPGFIVNRVARHFYVEGLKVLEENVASLEDIDALVESCGFKMGPFKLMDLIGVDTNLSVTTSIFHLFNEEGRFRPNRIQQQKVNAGMHGRKSGKGFYAY